MAITTLDGLIAGMQTPQEFLKIGTGTQVAGRLYTPMYTGGQPGAMSAPAGGLQGLGLTTKAGCISFANPGAGNTYLARFAGECINQGTLYLADRLWENSGNSATSTGTQTVSVAASAISQANPTQVTTAAHGQAAGTFTVVITGSNSTPVIDGTWTATYVNATNFTIPVNVTVAGSAGVVRIGIPPRDGNGTATGSAGNPTKFGDDVMLAYEVSSTMGANTSTITANYINQDGAAKTTVSITMAATMITGAFIPLPLAAGDTGVRAVTDHIKGTTQTSGTYHLVMYRILSRVGVVLPGVAAAVDAVTGGMPRLYDNSVPFLLWMPNTTTAPTQLSGQVIYSQG